MITYFSKAVIIQLIMLILVQLLIHIKFQQILDLVLICFLYDSTVFERSLLYFMRYYITARQDLFIFKRPNLKFYLKIN